jgi:FtsP/CotA-like multicopper oxidase with cupredoxin domain
MRPEVGRRWVLQVATLGAAATVVGGVGTWKALVAPRLDTASALSSLTGLRTGEALRDPPVLASTAGVLAVDLTAAAGVTLAGRRTSALGYNGSSPGPTLRVAPGDLLRVRLVNDLGETTNLHTHGLHVSPQGGGDDVFRMVEAGRHADYEYTIPADHPAGTFWYHPNPAASSRSRCSAGCSAPSSSHRPNRPRLCANGCWWSATPPSPVTARWRRSAGSR